MTKTVSMQHKTKYEGGE